MPLTRPSCKRIPPSHLGSAGELRSTENDLRGYFLSSPGRGGGTQAQHHCRCGEEINVSLLTLDTRHGLGHWRFVGVDTK